jgi:putative aldouronate transport system permease protein
MIVITMFVSGGMIPGYLLVSSLGLLDTMWSVLLPVAINTYNMIVIRTSFQSLPESLIESAKIDGANDFYILGKIVMPLSKAVLATMVLFYSVSHWNNYFSPMIYLNTKSKYPLQIILRNLVVSGMFSEESSMMGSVSQFRVTEMTIRYAVIIFATLPILCVYPFVQKYFVKGVMIGSLKE